MRRKININISNWFSANSLGAIYNCVVDGSSDRSLMLDPLSYFSFQPVFHDWCNKGRGMCYPIDGMVHINEPMLLIEKKVAHVVAAAGFFSRSMNGHLPYVRRHISVNTMC